MKSRTVVEHEDEPIVSDKANKQECVPAVIEPPCAIEQKPQEKVEPVPIPTPEGELNTPKDPIEPPTESGEVTSHN